MLLGDLALHHHAVVDRIEPGLAIEAHALGDGIGEERLDVGMAAQIGGAAVDQVDALDIVDRRVQLAGEDHRGDALLGWDVVHGHAGRWREAGGAAMAALGRPLHPEFQIAVAHAELVLQDAARPQRRGLLVFGDADALPFQVRRRLDMRVAAHEDAGMEEASRGEDRDADPAIVAPAVGHEQRGDRHLRHVELGEMELAPEHLRGSQHRDGQVDGVRHDAAVEHRPGARIVGQGDAEIELHGSPFAAARGLPNFDASI